MTSFVKCATACKNDTVTIQYVKYTNGIGYENKTDVLDTSPIGTWSEIKSVSDTLRYEQFLDTMVHKTTETRRKMALVELENVLCENSNTRSIIRVLNAIKILDPTFVPPVINMKCSWQKHLVKNVCEVHIPEIIKTNTSDLRLEKFFRVLQLIETESPH
jgi:hypothetical protein